MTQARRRVPLAPTRVTPHACPRPVRLQVLARARYFAGLPAAAIEAIDARMRVRGYAEDTPIHRVGEAASHLYVLAEGKVKLIRPTLAGDDVLIDVLTPGDLFGSAAALGHATYPDTAHTLTVACALSISARDFRAVLVEYPRVALAVLDDVTQRLEQAHTTVRRLASGTVEHRVASTLLALADKVGEPRGGEILLQLPLTRPDLAAMTGTTTESVSRTLSRLRRAGVIATGRRWISITDRVRLAEVARQ